MILREIVSRLPPGLLAIAGGAIGHALWGEPAATVLAAGMGALAGGLFLQGLGGPQDAQAGEPRRTAAPPRARAPAGRQQRAVDAALGSEAGRLLLDRLPLPVLVIDGADLVRFANSMAVELLERVPDGPFAAATLRMPKLMSGIAEVRATGRPGAVNLTAMRGRELHLRAHMRLLETAEGAPLDHTMLDHTAPDGTVVVVIEDVTQSQRSERVYRDFVANASHELKTPLASITGIVETLQGHARDDPDAAARFLGIMEVQAERMRRLINDMLSLNRIEQNERVPPRKPQRLRDILGETAESMAPVAARAGIAFEFELPGAEIVVLGSREELAQVFQNLVDNAIKHSRSGDRVRVSLAEARTGRAGMIGVAVSDTGPGIDRTHLPRLTERFYRVSVPRSRARGGTGLGLAIVKHVLSRHRGHLEVESALGEGSCFTVWLPVAEEAVAEAADRVA